MQNKPTASENLAQVFHLGPEGTAQLVHAIEKGLPVSMFIAVYDAADSPTVSSTGYEGPVLSARLSFHCAGADSHEARIQAKAAFESLESAFIAWSVQPNRAGAITVDGKVVSDAPAGPEADPGFAGLSMLETRLTKAEDGVDALHVRVTGPASAR